MAITCGIDWAENHHDVALVDGAGQLVAKRRINDDAEGYRQLLGMLAEAGDSPQELIPVAVETARGLPNILRTDADVHRPLPADSELAQAISVLARAQQDAVWNRAQLNNQTAPTSSSTSQPRWPLSRPGASVWTPGKYGPCSARWPVPLLRSPPP